MKLKTIYVLPVGIALLLIVGGLACSHSLNTPTAAGGGQSVAYYTCPMHPSVHADKPGSCPICGMGLQPVFANTSTNGAPLASTTNAAADVKPYPLDVCLVDGMKLGSMGDPYVFTYQGQEIKFCCAGCKPDFLKDPAKYLQKLPATTKN